MGQDRSEKIGREKQQEARREQKDRNIESNRETDKQNEMETQSSAGGDLEMITL